MRMTTKLLEMIKRFRQQKLFYGLHIIGHMSYVIYQWIEATN